MSLKEWWVVPANNLFAWGTMEHLGKNCVGGGEWEGGERQKGEGWGGVEMRMGPVSQGESLPDEMEC